MALTDTRTGRYGDHDVRELAAPGLAHPDAAKLDRRRHRVDGGDGGGFGLGRCAIHQDVDVGPDQARGREQHERTDEKRSNRVAVRVALVRKNEPEQDRRRACEIASEMEGVGGESRARRTA